MAGPLVRAVGVLALALLLGAGAAARLARARTAPALLQLVGAAGLLVVGLSHLAEALHVFAFMGWGQPRSVGHYLDLAGAVLGATLFPIGYLADALTRRDS